MLMRPLLVGAAVAVVSTSGLMALKPGAKPKVAPAKADKKKPASLASKKNAPKKAEADINMMHQDAKKKKSTTSADQQVSKKKAAGKSTKATAEKYLYPMEDLLDSHSHKKLKF
ncbi:unnamed protein product [Amoebophrya sp. A25]|nr:unnamed protein product [Amoebophrya sp. A25]|eukprot:GSA25T00016582001.1